MALSASNPALYSDLTDLYTKLNSVISNFGDGMSTINAPSQSTITPSDIVRLQKKMDAMKNDDYLGSVPSLYAAYTTGMERSELLHAPSGEPTSINNLYTRVVCRNTAACTFGKNNHGNNNNGNNSNGTNSNSTNSNGNNNNSTNSNGTKSNGLNFNVSGSNQMTGACTAN